MPVWFEYRDSENKFVTPETVKQKAEQAYKAVMDSYKLVEVYAERFPEGFLMKDDSIRRTHTPTVYSAPKVHKLEKVRENTFIMKEKGEFEKCCLHTTDDINEAPPTSLLVNQ